MLTSMRSPGPAPPLALAGAPGYYSDPEGALREPLASPSKPQRTSWAAVACAVALSLLVALLMLLPSQWPTDPHRVAMGLYLRAPTPHRARPAYPPAARPGARLVAVGAEPSRRSPVYYDESEDTMDDDRDSPEEIEVCAAGCGGAGVSMRSVVVLCPGAPRAKLFDWEKRKFTERPSFLGLFWGANFWVPTTADSRGGLGWDQGQC